MTAPSGMLVRRTAASGVLLTAAAVLLWVFGPRPTPVYADVYTTLASSAGFMVPPGGARTDLRNGKVLVNGATFNYVVGRSRLTLEALLSHYEQQFETTHVDGRRMSSATRLEANGAGVVAGMHFGQMREPADMFARVNKFAQSGRLNDLAQFHLISAYSNNGTVFIDLTPSAEVKVQTLLVPSKEDAPGEDLQGVTRPPGMQRLFTLEHGEGPQWSRTLIYRSADAVDAANGFGRSLLAAGWTQNPAMDGQGVGHFTDGRRECFLAGVGTGRNGVLILVQRNLSRGTAP